MSKVVRQSKYRHVFGTAYKNELCYSELRPNIQPHDSNQIKANSLFFAVPWQGGGGSVAIIPHTETGKKAAELPTISGHTGQVQDFDFNPFNDYIIATGASDCSVKVWGIPEGGLKETITEPLVSLDAHQKKITWVLFHPTSNNVLLSTASDNLVKIWDIETGKDNVTVKEDAHQNQNIQSVCWNRDGSQIATTCKDKKLRVLDPRAGTVAMETEGHQGTKGSRITWLGKMDKIFTAGFTKLSERHYMIFDPRKINEPIANQQIDVSSGLLIPLYDEDTSIMYLAGKGDGNIRYYEVVDEDPYVHSISEFKTTNPQRGMCMLPKVAMDTSMCEVSRLYKLTNNQVIPIMFQVPRKSELFQADIFPDTAAPEPTQTAAEYFSGNNAQPKLSSMNPAENKYAKGVKLSDFVPKVEKKAVEVKLPQKTNDPKELLSQNEELRKRVEQLELENAELKQKLAELGQ